jgi:hypothetical protein
MSARPDCASVASVLRPWPVADTRVRADSLGGRSTTCSPSAKACSRCACRCPGILRSPTSAPASASPPPASPPTWRRRRHTGPGQQWPSSPAMISIVAGRLCGPIGGNFRISQPGQPDANVWDSYAARAAVRELSFRISMVAATGAFRSSTWTYLPQPVHGEMLPTWLACRPRRIRGVRCGFS